MREDDYRQFPLSNTVVRAGMIAVPLLILGELIHSTSLCLAAAAIAVVAVLLHVVLILAGV